MTATTSILCALLGTLPVTTALSSGADCFQPRLEISVTVNGRPAVPDPLIRTGGPVHLTYRLTNPGDWDIGDIRLTAPRGTIVCPSGGAEVPVLEAHRSVTCEAVVDSAAAGTQDGTVTATGQVRWWWHDDDHHDWRQSVTASAPVGYRGVGGLITATDSVSVTPTASGGRATFAYTVTDVGNLPVYDFSLADPLVPAAKLSCGGISGGLAPGAG
ncbi:hypothetical protein KGQ20_41915 [Catenulispora sp. NF23]|uniref:hypothetical protein n=1 Tax=Catenulispora pinistramenti TaxID=2705254 RepID=UPI001BA4CA35|nr:hypothetical protein [Catenulispora pinistramenti]MBS2539323.1 hypothetical protein [Catenulispora pinistramenti]